MRGFLKAFLTLCFLVILVEPVDASTEFHDQQRVIITFKDEVNENIIKEANGEINHEFENIPVASVTISESDLKELENNSKIRKIEKDVLVQTSAQIQGWANQSINVPLAWGTGYTGKGVKVAVIDSGISPHEDLVIAGGKSFVDYTTSYYDDNGHGTHVAGIIAARDNGFGINGVASEAELYAIKSFNQNGTTYLSNIIAGIDWAISNDMDIINLSLGAQVGTVAFQNMVDKAYNEGILLVAAAGNDGTGLGDTVDFPARYSSVIGVGAIDQQNSHATFSSTGPSIEVVAPGVSILSTFSNGSYASLDGTSMATPFVAGYLALLKQAYPTLTNIQLRSILIENTIDLGEPGRDQLFGYGLVQASTFKQPLFSVPASLNPAIELNINTLSLKEFLGETQQLTALVKLKDGTVLDITNEAVWESTDSSIASVFVGKVETNKIGRTIISANYGGLSTSVEIEIFDPNPPKEVVKAFSDVNSDFWAYAEITQLREKQIISGYSNNTFKPSETIRRDHVAVLFTKSILLENRFEVQNFLDVPGDHHYYEEIMKTQQAGIFSGNKGNFEPQRDLTRAQMAKVLVIAFNLEEKGEHPFTDVSKTHWSNDYISILYSNGITFGSNGKYKPEDPVTRAQFAVFLSRAFALNRN